MDDSEKKKNSVDLTNGFVLSGVLTNIDILCNILALVPPKDLVFSCRLVCKEWCDVIDKLVWHLKLIQSPYRKEVCFHKLPWHILYWIIHKEPFGVNLLNNNSGQDGLREWHIRSNGGNKWAVEKPPRGCDELPYTDDIDINRHNPSCFVSSFHNCCKQQKVDLYKKGAVSYLMDDLQPDIIVTEWCAGRFDCSSNYGLSVKLVKSDESIVDSFEFQREVGGVHGTNWHKVTHTFKNYGTGVRYVLFCHYGVDRQFWAGHYGSKMAGALVQLVIPKVSNPPVKNIDLLGVD